MRSEARRAPVVIAAVLAITGAGLSAAAAQDLGRRDIPPGWHIHRVHVVGHRSPAAPRLASDRSLASERSLTVRKPLGAGENGDIFVDGGTVYGDVAAFVPAPRIDSGVQFPYGLDGVGGYGSDLGFSAGNDSANYDRGALDAQQALILGAR